MYARLGRGAALAATLSLVVVTTACTSQSPASTREASTPAVLFRHASVEGAWRAAVERRRPMVVLFTSDNCQFCEQMLAEIHANADVRQLLVDHAEAALAKAADHRELVKKLGIRGYPTSLVVATDGQIVDAIEGYIEAPKFAARLARWIGPGATAQTAPAVAAAR